MHYSVQTGFRNELALEHIIPVCNGKLTGQDECFPVVPVIYDLFKIMLYVTILFSALTHIIHKPTFAP